MPFNLLLLPLVGGYFFLDKFILTQYVFSRTEGNRLIIKSVIPGVGLLVLSFIITYFGAKLFPAVSLWWKVNIPFEYTGTAFLALLMGYYSPVILNRFFDPAKYTEKIFEKFGTVQEVFFHNAINSAEQISVTLQNEKVYVGYLTYVDHRLRRLLDQPKYIALFPSLSGYRDQNTKELHITTDYLELFQADEWDQEKFLIYIPLAEIRTFNYFNLGAFVAFREST